MGKPLLLFGAGASIDAGLHDTYTLTRKIYDLLSGDNYKVAREVFGYAIAKVLTRKIRAGGTPFDLINVEEAYDAVERLVFRDRDILSEFVSSWDPFLNSLKPQFDTYRFSSHLQRAFNMDYRRSMSGQGSLSVDALELRKAGEEIAAAIAATPAGVGRILPQLTQALMSCLSHDKSKTDYMASLLSWAVESGGAVGSLNYDLVVEDTLAGLGVSYDYGLTEWNSKKIVTFSKARSNLRLMKLHGSMNWSSELDDIKIEDPLKNHRPLMVFGGANSKLRADGPFLQLRHEFERELLSTNLLVIVGYSFADGHLNAIVRRWVSTRRKAKMIVVDPSPVFFGIETVGTPYRVDKSGRLESKTVDLVHIKKKAADGVPSTIKAASDPINLKIPAKNGVLPHILVTMIE